MKFICVKLNGGLGNQLFQYATARALANKNGRVLLDVTNYNNDYLGRQLGLNHFRIKAAIVKSHFVEKLFKSGTKLNRLISLAGFFSEIREDGFKVHENLAKRLSLLTFIEGYWQTAEYFEHIRPILVSEFEPRNKPDLPDFLNSNSIAVHVRRTDYMTDDRYGFIGKEYYMQAIQFFRENIRGPKFIFFSDDLNWCKEVFKGEDICFFDDPEWSADYLQLFLMAQCKHQIIANSSFSWWSAWLNKNPAKMVVRPLVPFKDNSICYENYYPTSWIVL